MGFYWSYTLLLKPPVLMRSWCYVRSPTMQKEFYLFYLQTA